MSAPGDYEAVKPRKTELPCTMDDVADFVVSQHFIRTKCQGHELPVSRLTLS